METFSRRFCRPIVEMSIPSIEMLPLVNSVNRKKLIPRVLFPDL